MVTSASAGDAIEIRICIVIYTIPDTAAVSEVLALTSFGSWSKKLEETVNDVIQTQHALCFSITSSYSYMMAVWAIGLPFRYAVLFCTGLQQSQAGPFQQELESSSLEP